MTAFLKIDECKACRRSIPWEWVPAVPLNGRSLSGTGVWRSQLTNGVCPACSDRFEAQRKHDQRVLAMRKELVQLLGGEKPVREFTFERFRVAPGNERAFSRCKAFDPAVDNLYLWGSCGVGKTHLAYAAARRCFEETISVTILIAGQLSRKTRMKEPEQEQAVIDALVSSDVLLLDDLGSGSNTDYSRQVLQEILDGRDFQDRAGLMITSAYSLDGLAERFGSDAIPSRLASLCSIMAVRGPDERLARSVSQRIMGGQSSSPPQL